MTLRGADEDELARAVKHSMVVIDAEKHKLDYKRSERENGIPELKQKWQIRVDEEGATHYGGASTLLSRRKQTVRVPERRGSIRVDKETGEYIYKESGRTFIDPKTGKERKAERRYANTIIEIYNLVEVCGVCISPHSVCYGIHLWIQLKRRFYGGYYNGSYFRC